MRRLRLSRPSPALIISLIALMVALGGTSYAAFRLPAGSVGTKQLAKGAVSTAKLKNGAVTGSKVAPKSLTGANINIGTLGTVPSATNAGHASNAGSATNASHATNADSSTNASHATTADSATTAATASALGSVAYRFDTSAGPVTVPACADNPCTPDQVGTTYAIATCPQGTVAVGGGGETYDAGVELSGSFPRTFFGHTQPDAWQVDVDNFTQTTSRVDYYVVCASAKTVDNPSGL